MRLLETTSFADFPPMRGGVLHPVDLCLFDSDLYDEPVIFVSDLHKDALRALDFLLGFLAATAKVEARQWVFVSLGDIAGTDRFGEDGDPTETYRWLHGEFARFYFVDGNHDRPQPRAFELTNTDGTPCSLQMGPGRIGDRVLAGVPGILSRKDAPGKLSPDVFEHVVTQELARPGLDTFVTHDTPRLDAFRPPIGNPALTALVQAHGPRVHAFGHCHLEPATVTAGPTTYINSDRRFIMLLPG